MLKSKYNEQTEISRKEFGNQIRSLVRGVRDTFFLTNAETQSIAKTSKNAIIGGLSILDWCGLEYTRITRPDDDGKETVYIKITNLQSGDSK